MPSTPVIPFPSKSGLRELWTELRWQKSFSVVLSGSLVMLFGSMMVSGINFGYNVAMARMLGPALFGHVTAAVTLLMLVSAMTLSFQMVCAKFVAKNEGKGGRAAVYHGLMKRAWVAGILVSLGLALASTPVANYLHIPDHWLLVVLGTGMAFYIPLGVRRGNLQGLCQFSKLTWNFVGEAATKFIVAVALVALGYGVMGAVGAIAASVFAAFVLPASAPKPGSAVETETYIPASFREGIQAIVFFIGQVVINNIDILLVKHYFDPRTAGIYAAVALVGRVLYFAAWSVVSAMFPVSAAAKREKKLPVLAIPLAAVALMGAAFVAAMALFPDFIMRVVFGASFNVGRDLLSLYAMATALYSLSVVLMAYEMSRKIANTGWLQLVFSGALVVLIGMFHNSLRQVILVQIFLMLGLLAAVSVPFLKTFREDSAEEETLAAPLQPIEVAQAATAQLAGMNILRRVTEAEVIAEFLKNEFYQKEFDTDREQFEQLVLEPNLTDEMQNAVRRALLFRRRGHMWRELPGDTQWYEVELKAEALERVRVFPRAHWRTFANGSFAIKDIAERIRNMPVNRRCDAVISKIQLIRYRMQREPMNSSVMLIGVDDKQPLTILEGNHRMTAALLVSPTLAVKGFRILCGVSPRMSDCCWYRTNLPNLWKYGKNRLRNVVDREADVARVVNEMYGTEPLPALPKIAGTPTATEPKQL